MTDKIISIGDQIKAVDISIGYFSVEARRQNWGDDQNAYSKHIERLKAAKETLEKLRAERTDR
jgi:hypothetical protein